ncbi:MAG: hypothetical protein ACREK3_04835 [Gemmatimonadota bacterium]
MRSAMTVGLTRDLRPLRLAATLLVVILGTGCGEQPPDEDASAPGDPAPSELAQPPSAGAPRASQPGFSPDTMRPDAAEEDTLAMLDAAPATSDLSVDSIVGQYRNHYAAELVEIRTGDAGAEEVDAVEAAQRRTALDFGYVEMTAWSDMVADLTEAQRTELARRVEQANRELAQEVQREDPGGEP